MSLRSTRHPSGETSLDGGGSADRVGQRPAPACMLEPPPSGGTIDTAIACGRVAKRSC